MLKRTLIICIIFGSLIGGIDGTHLDEFRTLPYDDWAGSLDKSVPEMRKVLARVGDSFMPLPRVRNRNQNWIAARGYQREYKDEYWVAEEKARRRGSTEMIPLHRKYAGNNAGSRVIYPRTVIPERPKQEEHLVWGYNCSAGDLHSSPNREGNTIEPYMTTSFVKEYLLLTKPYVNEGDGYTCLRVRRRALMQCGMGKSESDLPHRKQSTLEGITPEECRGRGKIFETLRKAENASWDAAREVTFRLKQVDDLGEDMGSGDIALTRRTEIECGVYGWRKIGTEDNLGSILIWDELTDHIERERFQPGPEGIRAKSANTILQFCTETEYKDYLAGTRIQSQYWCRTGKTHVWTPWQKEKTHQIKEVGRSSGKWARTMEGKKLVILEEYPGIALEVEEDYAEGYDRSFYRVNGLHGTSVDNLFLAEYDGDDTHRMEWDTVDLNYDDPPWTINQMGEKVYFTPKDQSRVQRKTPTLYGYQRHDGLGRNCRRMAIKLEDVKKGEGIPDESGMDIWGRYWKKEPYQETDHDQGESYHIEEYQGKGPRSIGVGLGKKLEWEEFVLGILGLYITMGVADYAWRVLMGLVTWTRHAPEFGYPPCMAWLNLFPSMALEYRTLRVEQRVYGNQCGGRQTSAFGTGEGSVRGCHAERVHSLRSPSTMDRGDC